MFGGISKIFIGKGVYYKGKVQKALDLPIVVIYISSSNMGDGQAIEIPYLNSDIWCDNLIWILVKYNEWNFGFSEQRIKFTTYQYWMF